MLQPTEQVPITRKNEGVLTFYEVCEGIRTNEGTVSIPTMRKKRFRIAWGHWGQGTLNVTLRIQNKFLTLRNTDNIKPWEHQDDLLAWRQRSGFLYIK